LTKSSLNCCDVHEGRKIAEWFNSVGVSAFVLNYRYNPYNHPVLVTDGRRSVRMARFLSREYGYENVGIMGFSAGGHLAGSVGDRDVPVENSLLMASALSRYKVPFELHTFADGGHGVGLANGVAPTCHFEYIKFWTENLKNWLKSRGYM